MVLTLNLIWEPVFAKNKGEGGMLSEYYKKKQYKKMMKAAVPLMTFIGSMGKCTEVDYGEPLKCTIREKWNHLCYRIYSYI